MGIYQTGAVGCPPGRGIASAPPAPELREPRTILEEPSDSHHHANKEVAFPKEELGPSSRAPPIRKLNSRVLVLVAPHVELKQPERGN